MLIDLLTDKHRLDGFVNFLTQIIAVFVQYQFSYNISRSLVFKRHDKADRILHVGIAAGNLEVG